MGTFRLLWTVAIWSVLVVASSASQLFEELPPQSLDDSRPYQEGIDLDSGLHASDTSVNDQSVLGQTEEEKALFLIKIMQALRMRNEDNGHYRRAIPESVDFLDVQNMEGYGHDEGKPLMVKRLSGDPNPIVATVVKPKSYEAQRRWKAKKGSQMLCYFKLCAFRPPS